jgi:2-phosphosulfolactate phosphatase
VFIGCFLNLSAVARRLAAGRGDAALLCAGTEGEVSAEDVAFAGALALEIEKDGIEMTESAVEAARVWRKSRRSLRKFLAESRGGVPLVKIGLGRDTVFCAQRDRFEAVPRVAEKFDGFRITAS